MTANAEHYDVFVVGGGIQGAGIALVAQKSGYRVLLIEKNTWGSGTSSKSSKLIHGGLRYLQTGQLKLVYECLRERQWMLKSCPSLVKPNWFYIPIYQDSIYRPWKIHTGLLLYQLLSGFSRFGRFRKLRKHQWKNLSGLDTNNLQAVFAYQDAQTDDEALTKKVVDFFLANGGEALEQTSLVDAEKVGGLHQLNLKTGEKLSQVTTSCIVNATGPWVNQVLPTLVRDSKPVAVDLVQGSHIIIEPQLSDECFYLQAKDGRAVFCLPWKGKTLVGTTELVYESSPESATPTDFELDYLNEVVHHYFPHYKYRYSSSFCGLRVLPKSNEKAFSRSRDTFIKPTGSVISVYGGKLTSWRATASKVLFEIDRLLDKSSTINIDKLFD